MLFDINVDWIGFTFKNDDLPAESQFWGFKEEYPEFESYIAEHELISMRSHYEYTIKILDGVLIMFDEKGDKGVNVQIPGHLLGDLYKIFTLSEDQALYDFLDIISSRHSKLSRLDIAYDDYDKVFMPQDFDKFNDLGFLKSRSKQFSLIKSYDRGVIGSTFYVGRRSSDRIMRIYDKAAESYDYNLKVSEKDCIRYELELHGRNCHKIQEFYLKNGYIDVESIFRSTLEIVSGSDSNKSRRSLLPEWEAFLNLKFNEIKTMLTKLPNVSEHDSKQKLEKTVCRYLGTIRVWLQLYDNDYDQLLALIKSQGLSIGQEERLRNIRDQIFI